MGVRCCQYNHRRWIAFIIFFIILSNFTIGLFVISSVLTAVKEETLALDRKVYGQSSISNAIVVRIDYQYYFRIDYTIIHGVCKPVYVFNTTNAILSIQDLTNLKLNTITRDVTIDFNVISINPILIKTDKIRKNVTLKKYLKTICDYVLELNIGFNFPSYCHFSCQSQVLKRLTSQTRPFGHPLDDPFTFNLSSSNTREPKIQYQIQQVLLFQTSQYLNKLVYIRSYYQTLYVSALVVDISSHQSSITVSEHDRSLFNITIGLDSNSYERNCSNIYLSFSTTLASNTYLRHQNGRVNLRKNDQSSLFKQDSTFKILKNNQIKDMVAFESINVPHSFIAVGSYPETSVILAQQKLKVNGTMKTIDDLDNRFLFKLVLDE